MNNRLTALLAALAGTLVLCSSAQAQWQWRDANGRMVISDQAPPPEVPERSIIKGPGFRPLDAAQVKELTQQKRGLPTQWTLGIELYLYVGTNTQMDDTVTPSLLLNPILDAVDNALRPDNQVLGTCTLGGLVSHAWIAGAIETSEGNLGSIEVAIVPIEMLVPN